MIALSGTYRADATILILRIPIYSRQDVGLGRLTIEGAGAQGGGVSRIRFFGASKPERARKLNRMGYIDEVLVESGGKAIEAAYFGFMTSSPEEDVSSAKKSLDTSGTGTQLFATVSGHVTSAEAVSHRTKTQMPSSYVHADFQKILDGVRAAILGVGDNTPRPELLASKSTGVVLTFLQAIRQGTRSTRGEYEADFYYKGELHHLKLQKHSDPDRGRKLAAKGLTGAPEKVVRFDGKTNTVGSSKTTGFSFWIEDAPGPRLPLLIQWQPRSFLRLSFELEMPGPKT